MVMAQRSATDLDRIFSALVTPMAEDESINEGAIEGLIEFQLDQGVEGFYCCGSSGEAPLLDVEERMNFVRRVVRTVAGRAPVVAHVGAVSTADTIRLAVAAQEDGADAVSMVPPYYYSFSQREIIDHYRRVMDACGLPMIVYNIPQFTSVAFDKISAAELFEDPRVIGLKHTSQDLYALERIRTAHPDLTLLNGFDEMYLPALAAGARGCVGTTVNVQARRFVELRRRFESGDMVGARQMQKRINDVVETFVEHGIFSCVKFYLELSGIDAGRCRAPFARLDSAAEDAVRAVFEEIRSDTDVNRIPGHA
jgi:N-acetylneuraminate lyase